MGVAQPMSLQEFFNRHVVAPFLLLAVRKLAFVAPWASLVLLDVIAENGFELGWVHYAYAHLHSLQFACIETV